MDLELLLMKWDCLQKGYIKYLQSIPKDQTIDTRNSTCMLIRKVSDNYKVQDKSGDQDQDQNCNIIKNGGCYIVCIKIIHVKI